MSNIIVEGKKEWRNFKEEGQKDGKKVGQRRKDRTKGRKDKEERKGIERSEMNNVRGKWKRTQRVNEGQKEGFFFSFSS